MGTSANPSPRILVVEDEILVRNCAVAQLEEAGFQVISAGDAEAGLYEFEHQFGLTAVFTDISMPGRFDGLSLAHLMAKMRPEVQLIITSGLAPPGRALPAGAHFLTKPYNCCVLPSLIKAA